MKVCNVFELKTPTKQQVINILTKVNVSLETTMMNKLVDYIQGDLRKLEFKGLIGPATFQNKKTF